MGIEQRMASSGDIARHVGITINKRIEPPEPISSYKKGQVISRAPVQKKKADVQKAYVESIGRSALGVIFPPSLLVTYPETIKTVVEEAEKEDPVLALKLKEIGEGAYAGGMGSLGIPALGMQVQKGFEATEKYREELVIKYPDIPILQEVSYTLPEIKIPEIKMPDFGKWILIAGLVLGAILIIPALLSRRRS